MFNVRRDQCKKSNRRLHLLKSFTWKSAILLKYTFLRQRVSFVLFTDS